MPETPADIPGLGPIRIRALQKAGLDNLVALRGASLEQLQAVPGITAIKARHIQTYLAQFPPELVAARAKARPTAPASSPKQAGAQPEATAAPLLIQWEEGLTTPSTEPLSPLTVEAVQAMGKTITLLLSVHATKFRPRLLRELARFARLAESLAMEPDSLSPRDQERAMKRLRRAGEELVEAAQDDIDRKAQARLADSLGESCDRLAALRGEASHDKKAEDPDA